MPRKNEEDPKGKPKRNSSAYPKRKSSGGPSKRKTSSGPGGRSGDRPAGKSSEFKKRPDHSKGDSGERPERKPGEYPKKKTDYPKGDSNERPERNSGDRPKRNSTGYSRDGGPGERPERNSGDRPKRNSTGYSRDGGPGERPERNSEDRPKRNSTGYSRDGGPGERPERRSGEGPPRRKSNDGPPRNSSERPDRNMGDGPKRRPNDRAKPKPKDRAKVQSSLPHQGKKPKDKGKDKDKDLPKFHPRNQHQQRYDFKRLVESLPELASFVKMNMHNEESISFTDPEAVKMLNIALLKHYYGVEGWDIPATYQVPATPVRADYIHHIAELLGNYNDNVIPTGAKIKCLDIGVGASCIYPIIGRKEYEWSFIGSDIDPVAIESAKAIIEANAFLKEGVECRLQPNPKDIFQGIIQNGEWIDLAICNPPYHIAPATEAETESKRKPSTLKMKKAVQAIIKQGIENGELSCEGGEEAFLQIMISQSQQYAKSCYWFSTLVGKQSHQKSAYKALEKLGAKELKIIPMGQGNKSSRLLVWSFLNREEQKEWRDKRWNNVPADEAGE